VDILVSAGFNEIIFERLYKFCSFGSYTALSKKSASRSSYKLVAKTDVITLDLSVEQIMEKREQSQLLEKVLT